MAALLTIAIPTYNRAALLDRQLAWLAEAIKGCEAECEVTISDNCSTDETAQVVAKWRPLLEGVSLYVNRNPRNIGAIRNIAYCINSARGKYVWTISDDDRIDPGAIRFVLGVLRAHPELALLILNFSSRHMNTGVLNFERCFDVERDEVRSDGQAVFERYLAYDDGARWGGLALTTALVYRSDLAQRALREWPAGLDNLTVQLYVTAFCALHGPVKVTKENHLECLAGTHFFKNDSRLLLGFRGADMPEAFLKLMEIGYSCELCRTKILKQYREFSLSTVVTGMRRWPGFTLLVVGRYLRALARAQLGCARHAATVRRLRNA